MSGQEHYNEVLLLDEENYPILIEGECTELKPIVTDFVNAWVEHKDRPVEEWLSNKLQQHLPEKPQEEIKSIAEEIIFAIKQSEESMASLDVAIQNGRSKESWFASQIQKVTSNMSAQEASMYLNELDVTLQNANESLYKTITTKTGAISQNTNLDGFIAEQYHAQTFNLNAEATGSPYRAKVLEPDGTGYAKNSVDIVIVDGDGKVVRKYQSKYCKDAQATQEAFEHGDYRGQRKLVPEGQEGEITNASTVIEAPDGTKSKPLSKERAKELQEEAQSGNWSDLNWNEYKTKDLAIGIGKQAGYAALQGAAIGVGIDVASKLWNGEEIKGEEVVETALKSGADFGIKAAASGALKVGAEKGIITVIPKGTPAGTIANIAYVAVENAKIAGKIATGEYTVKEGLDKMEQATVATVAGMATMAKGAAIGAKAGMIFGPVGVAAGGFIGGTVGYMAGSKVGETVVKGVQKVREKSKEIIKIADKIIVKTAKSIRSGIKDFACSLGNGIAGLLGF